MAFSLFGGIAQVTPELDGSWGGLPMDRIIGVVFIRTLRDFEWQSIQRSSQPAIHLPPFNRDNLDPWTDIHLCGCTKNPARMAGQLAAVTPSLALLQFAGTPPPDARGSPAVHRYNGTWLPVIARVNQCNVRMAAVPMCHSSCRQNRNLEIELTIRL